ncbi:hypothetical protein HK405_012673, partial [Cladochytrium tenue]
MGAGHSRPATGRHLHPLLAFRRSSAAAMARSRAVTAAPVEPVPVDPHRRRSFYASFLPGTRKPSLVPASPPDCSQASPAMRSPGNSATAFSPSSSTMPLVALSSTSTSSTSVCTQPSPMHPYAVYRRNSLREKLAAFSTDPCVASRDLGLGSARLGGLDQRRGLDDAARG